jgi:hypothetical protein
MSRCADTTANLLGFLGEPSGKIQVLKLIRSLTLHKPQYLDSGSHCSLTYQARAQS